MKKDGWSFTTDDYGCMNLERNPIPEGNLLCSEFTCLLAQLLRDHYEPKRLGTKFPGVSIAPTPALPHGFVTGSPVRRDLFVYPILAC